eukprot:UN23579
MQLTQQNKAREQFEAHADQLRKIVELVLDGVRDRARTHLLQKKLKISKSVSITQVKQRENRRAKQLRKSIQEQNRIGDFIRLVDYMYVSTLCQLTLTSQTALLLKLCHNTLLTSPIESPTKSSKTGILHTSVSF